MQPALHRPTASMHKNGCICRVHFFLRLRYFAATQAQYAQPSGYFARYAGSHALFARLLAMPIRRAFPGRLIAPTRTLRSNAYAQTDAGSTQPFSLARSINFNNCMHCTSLGCRVIEAFSINDIYFSSFGIKMRSRFANSRNDRQ